MTIRCRIWELVGSRMLRLGIAAAMFGGSLAPVYVYAESESVESRLAAVEQELLTQRAMTVGQAMDEMIRNQQPIPQMLLDEASSVATQAMGHPVSVSADGSQVTMTVSGMSKSEGDKIAAAFNEAGEDDQIYCAESAPKSPRSKDNNKRADDPGPGQPATDFILGGVLGMFFGWLTKPEPKGPPKSEPKK